MKFTVQLLRDSFQASSGRAPRGAGHRPVPQHLEDRFLGLFFPSLLSSGALCFPRTPLSPLAGRAHTTYLKPRNHQPLGLAKRSCAGYVIGRRRSCGWGAPEAGGAGAGLRGRSGARRGRYHVPPGAGRRAQAGNGRERGAPMPIGSAVSD